MGAYIYRRILVPISKLIFGNCFFCYGVLLPTHGGLPWELLRNRLKLKSKLVGAFTWSIHLFQKQCLVKLKIQ